MATATKPDTIKLKCQDPACGYDNELSTVHYLLPIHYIEQLFNKVESYCSLLNLNLKKHKEIYNNGCK